MSDDLPPSPWHEAEPDDDPSVMEAAIDKTVQSLLAGDLDPTAKKVIADAYRRALKRRQLPCVEGREQAMLTVAAGIKAAERLLDGGGKP
jgi:hypothetical protein